MSQIFRKSAMDKLTSPEHLDSLVTVTSPRGWAMLLGVLAIIISLLIWSIFGFIPEQIEAKGIVLIQGELISAMSDIDGQIESIAVNEGDELKIGDVIAVVNVDNEQRQIYAPADCNVAEIKAAKGDMVKNGSEVAVLISNSSRREEEVLIYVSIDDSRKIEIGTDVMIYPESIDTDRYGYMEGTVSHVSMYPASYQKIMSTVKNEALAENLTSDGKSSVEVSVKLKSDPNSANGFKWSKGAGTSINNGVLCQASVTVSKRRPIKLILPFLDNITSDAEGGE